MHEVCSFPMQMLLDIRELFLIMGLKYVDYTVGCNYTVLDLVVIGVVVIHGFVHGPWSTSSKRVRWMKPK